MKWQSSLVFVALMVAACGPLVDEEAPGLDFQLNAKEVLDLKDALPAKIGLTLFVEKKGNGSGEVKGVWFIDDVEFAKIHPFMLRNQRKDALNIYATECDKFYEKHKRFLDRYGLPLKDEFDKSKKLARAEIEKAKALTPEQLTQAATDALALAGLEAAMNREGVSFNVVNPTGKNTDFEVTLVPASGYSPSQIDAMHYYKVDATKYKADYQDDLISNLLDAQINAIPN